MTTRRTRPLLAGIALLLALPVVADDEPPPTVIEPLSWVEVQGSFTEDGRFRAREVEGTELRSPSVTGVIDEYDVVTGVLRVGALRVRVEERTRLQDASGAPLHLRV